MDFTLLYIVVVLGISTVLNILLKRLGISQIIGYIFTGTIIYHLFDAAHVIDAHMLEQLGEFGIVFLMFTIGLEVSLSKMNSMKTIIFTNGFLQVSITSVIFTSLFTTYFICKLYHLLLYLWHFHLAQQLLF